MLFISRSDAEYLRRIPLMFTQTIMLKLYFFFAFNFFRRGACSVLQNRYKRSSILNIYLQTIVPTREAYSIINHYVVVTVMCGTKFIWNDDGIDENGNMCTIRRLVDNVFSRAPYHTDNGKFHTHFSVPQFRVCIVYYTHEIHIYYIHT